MAEFTPSKKTAQDFNNGVEYVDGQGNETGDALQAQTINNLVESALYTQEQADTAKTIAENAKDLIDAAIQGGSTPPAIGLHHIQFAGEPTPAEIWAGTTWKIDIEYTGRALIGSGERYELGATGGTAEHTHGTSDLYAKIMMHSWGSIPASFKNVPKWQGSYVVESGGTGKSEVTDNWEGVNLGGELAKANNLQPYKVVNVWKRIA